MHNWQRQLSCKSLCWKQQNQLIIWSGPVHHTNWYVLVCTGMYLYKTVQAVTRFRGLVQVGTSWYKSVPNFLVLVQYGTSQHRIFRIGTERYKTVQVSTRFPAQAQDGTRRYKQIPNFLYTYRTVQDGTSWYPISTRTGRTGLYRIVQVSTGFSKWYILVYTGTY